jgi:hypothetical protein
VPIPARRALTIVLQIVGLRATSARDARPIIGLPGHGGPAENGAGLGLGFGVGVGYSTEEDAMDRRFGFAFRLASAAAVGAALAGTPGEAAAQSPLLGAVPLGVQLPGTPLYLGAAIQVENVTAWPVHTTVPGDDLDGEFVTLADAVDKAEAVVRETGDSGTVNELVIENKGKRPVLVLAGTVVKGGKQDRQVGQDFVIPAGKTVPVAAFCVEQGRWTATRDGVATHGVFKPKKALTTKAVRSAAQYDANQGKVWEKVSNENAKAGKAPPSGTFLATLEDDSKEAVARRERVAKTLSDRLAALATAPSPPVGIAYAVEGKVREVRTFSHAALFRRNQDTLVATVSVEADLSAREAAAAGRTPSAKPAEAAGVADLVAGAAAAKEERVKSKAGSVNAVRKSVKTLNSDCFADESKKSPVTRSFMASE